MGFVQAAAHFSLAECSPVAERDAGHVDSFVNHLGMRGDRALTATPHRAEERPLGLGADLCVEMVEPLAELGQALVVFPNFDSYRTLSHAGQHVAGLDHRGAKTIRNGIAPEEAVLANLKVKSAQTGVGEDGGIDLCVIAELLEPGRNVTSDLDYLPVRPKPKELGFAAGTAGG